MYVKKSQIFLTHFFPKFLLSEVFKSKKATCKYLLSVFESGYLNQIQFRVGKNALEIPGKNAKFCLFSSLYWRIIELRGKGHKPSQAEISSARATARASSARAHY